MPAPTNVETPKPSRAARPETPQIQAAPTDSIPVDQQAADEISSPPIEASTDGSVEQGVESEAQEIYESDEVMAPAPDASVFAPKAKPATAPRSSRTPYTQTLEFKRTVIPVMLTSGTIMLITAAAIFLAGVDSIFASIPAWLAIALLLFGLILLSLAAMNMMQVRRSESVSQ